MLTERLKMAASHSRVTALELWSWGYNSEGELGLGDIIDRSSPVQVGSLTTWDKIASNGYHSTVIKTDGTLWVWGHNSSGGLGLSDIIHRSSPVQVGSGTTWNKIASGAYYSLALKTQ